MNALERAAASNVWARRNVGEKILLCGGLLILAISLPPWPAAVAILIIVAFCVWKARVPLKIYLGMVTAPAAFVIVGVLPLFISISSQGFMLSPTGPERAAIVVARSITGICCTMLFALTTPLAELLNWMGQHGLPRSISYVAEMIYRMTDTLVSTARGMNDAQARRLGHETRRGMISGVAAQSANLFVIAFLRAQRLQEGLELRADPESTAVMDVVRPRDARFIALSVLAIAVVIALWLYSKWMW